jgi:hypothetical protein
MPWMKSLAFAAFSHPEDQGEPATGSIFEHVAT